MAMIQKKWIKTDLNKTIDILLKKTLQKEDADLLLILISEIKTIAKNKYL